MLLTPRRDPGKSWCSPGDRLLGALSRAGMQDWAFPTRWLIAGGGVSLPGPLVSAVDATKACGVAYAPLWNLYDSDSLLTGFNPHAPC